MRNIALLRQLIREELSASPKDRAVALAREIAGGGVDPRQACADALKQVPQLRWSADQLKAIAFGAKLHGFGQPTEGIVKEATGGDGFFELVTKDNVFHLEVGNEYRVKKMPNLQRFNGWSGDEDTAAEDVKLTFVDQTDGDEWEAYLMTGTKYFAWGSSGDRLIVKET
jgi:hypothetical protein